MKPAVPTIVLLALFLIISCENPQDLSNEQTLYKGQVVQSGPAPFLQNGNSLAKGDDASLSLADEIPSGIVYGLDNDPTVYTAEGGEILPIKSWIGNENENPLEVSLTSKLAIQFDSPTKVTVVEALNIIYVDVNGVEVLFSGSGLINTTEISTGIDGVAVLICTAEFSIGGEGGEIG